jgi:hypothetical protein
MYVYNLNDFTLKRSFELKQYDDLVFASFFIKWVRINIKNNLE